MKNKLSYLIGSFIIVIIIILNVFQIFSKKRSSEYFDRSNQKGIQFVHFENGDCDFVLSDTSITKKIEFNLKLSKKINEVLLKTNNGFFKINVGYKDSTSMMLLFYNKMGKGIIVYDNNYYRNDTLIWFADSLLKINCKIYR